MTFHLHKPVSTWKVWVAAHSSLYLCCSLYTVAPLSSSVKTDRVQDGIPAALFEVNGPGFIADNVGSSR